VGVNGENKPVVLDVPYQPAECILIHNGTKYNFLDLEDSIELVIDKLAGSPSSFIFSKTGSSVTFLSNSISNVSIIGSVPQISVLPQYFLSGYVNLTTLNLTGLKNIYFIDEFFCASSGLSSLDLSRCTALAAIAMGFFSSVSNFYYLKLPKQLNPIGISTDNFFPHYFPSSIWVPEQYIDDYKSRFSYLSDYFHAY
jgi:hypothetical protein